MSNEKMGDLDNQSKPSFSEQCFSYTDIANKLLKDKFLLTALELHSELVECGKEIPKLKEFFSNPGNFENQFSRSEYYGIQRSSSQATLDSLDLTRYSEDGERGVDERVAVLEFELRKAKETIQALRANLTFATECETPTAESTEPLQVEPIKPHEQRALNFLINEYLLRHQYKLTSITFADENGDQDFEDWDDVGLNIPKPAELLQLYRDAMRQPAHSPPTPTTHWAGQTDLPDPQTLQLASELEKLKEQVSDLEREKAEMMSRIERLTTHFVAEDAEPEPETVSVHSTTPERFEVIEREVAARPSSESGSGERGDDTSSLNEWTRLNESETGSAVGVAVSEREEPAGAEDPPIQLPPPTPTSQVRSLPPGFQREVLIRCLVNTRVAEATLLEELLTQTDSLARLTHTLATSLPRLIPLVTRREELIPLLVCTVQLLPEPSQRDTLLQALFSLRKRPQIDERRAILAGLVWLARVCGAAVIEAELLPLCWEQMSHRHREHRLLVAEACSALAPYISAGLRNSLLLSILQQLLTEDREDVVRLSCVNSLALITAVMTDTDKYTQCEELTLLALQDTSVLVTEAALNTLLPVLGQWAAVLGWLGERLLTRLINTLHTSCKPGESRWARAVPLVQSIRSLLPFLVLSVASVDVVTSRIQSGLAPAESRAGFAELCQGLANPAVFYDGEFTVGAVMSAFDLTVKDTRWPELDWVVEVMLPKMMDVLEMVDVTNEELLNSFVLFFKSFAAGFGKTVTVNMLKPLFACRLQDLEASLASLGSDWPCLSVIPVYLLAVLAPLQSEEEEAGLTLQRFTVSLALSRAPVDCLQLSVSRLSRLPALLETIMAALWTGVVHPRPAVRALTADLFGQAVPHAGESMTTNRIVPALITLASDQDITVKTATIPVFGKLVEHSVNKEVCDKTYFQLQSLLSDAAARDSHAAVLQLVATLGTIVSKCDQWFRDDVVVPWLAATAATTLQSTNQSRRLDLAAALVRAFSNVVYCELTNTTVTTALLPGLRYLEQICSQCLESQRETVLSMIQEAESRVEIPVKPIERSSSTITLAMATSNVGQGVEDMKNRVTKIFQTPISRPTNLPNLQSINIFRKK